MRKRKHIPKRPPRPWRDAGFSPGWKPFPSKKKSFHPKGSRQTR